MVHLLVALKPSDLEMMLHRGSSPYEDELKALERGELWEVKIKFVYASTNTAILPRRFVRALMELYDDFPLYHYLADEHLDLLQELVRIESPRLARLAQLAGRSIARAEIVFIVNDSNRSSVLGSEDFFEFLLVFIAELDRRQSRRTSSPRLWNNHAPFRVKNISLQLDQIHVTSQVCKFAQAIGQARIPVQLTHLGLDLRRVGCPETDFRHFIQAITAGTKPLSVGTSLRATDRQATADSDGQDRTERIRMFLGVIAEIESLHTLDFDGILAMCTSEVNREAVWRGLFEEVLSPGKPPTLRKFRMQITDPPVPFTGADVQFIAESAARWHKAHPFQILRLSELYLCFDTVDMGVVRALLAAFDDVEIVTLVFPSGTRREELRLQELDSEDIQTILRYPSIRTIFLSGVSIPTMDVFNPRIKDPRLPIKPVLRDLSLSRFRMTDRASLSRFLDELKHTAGAPSELEKKLEYLRLTWIGRDGLFDHSVLAVMDDVLTKNETLLSVSFSTDYEADDAGQALVRKHTGRIISSSDTSSVTAKARKLAFLSTLYGHKTDSPCDSARGRLDSTLVSKIFAFSATRIYFARKVRQEYTF